MICIRVALGPGFRTPILLVFVFVPKLFDAPPHLFGCLDLFEAQFGVVLHGGGLAEGHGDAVFFGEGAGGPGVSRSGLKR